MSSQPASKQSIIIGVLSGALVLSLGSFALYYFQSQSLPQQQQANIALAEKVVEEPKALQFPSNETALKELFGVSDPTGQVKTAPDQLTTFWFDQSTKLGADNLYVKFFATQNLDESGQPIDSHATAVEVGAITYKQNSSQWEVISTQLNFGAAGSSGKVDDEVKPEILQLSPTSFAVMVKASGGMGGWFDEGKTVFVFAQNAWHDMGYVKTGGDNSGSCDETPPTPDAYAMGPCYSYKGTISVVNGSTSEYPDLLITRTGTESKEHRGSLIPAKNVTYIFKDGQYINPNEFN